MLINHASFKAQTEAALTQGTSVSESVGVRTHGGGASSPPKRSSCMKKAPLVGTSKGSSCRRSARRGGPANSVSSPLKLCPPSEPSSSANSVCRTGPIQDAEQSNLGSASIYTCGWALERSGSTMR